MCIGNDSSNCLAKFEFFVVKNLTQNVSEDLQQTSGVIGIAPDIKENGPSFLTAL
jgi:hypothetical protein